MSIGSIVSSGFSPCFAANSRSLAKNNCSVARRPDQSTAPPAKATGLTAEESHLALRIRTRSSVHTSADGTTTERISSKLRFHYDLTTADGQRVELNVKAKIQQTTVQDADGNFVSKTHLKLQFSLLQQGVADGLSPLLDDPASSHAPSGVAGGLQSFLSAVDEALQQFTAGNNPSADDLLNKTVDAFNSLLGALSHLLFPPPATAVEPALPPTNQPPTSIDSLPGPLDPNPNLTLNPSLNPNLAPAPPPTEQPPPAPITTDETSPEPLPPAPAPDETPPPQPAATTSPAPIATQVLRDVRLRFVQSLTQIIGALTPPDSSGTSSLATSQYLRYQSALSIRIHSTSLVNATA